MMRMERAIPGVNARCRGVRRVATTSRPSSRSRTQRVCCKTFGGGLYDRGASYRYVRWYAGGRLARRLLASRHASPLHPLLRAVHGRRHRAHRGGRSGRGSSLCGVQWSPARGAFTTAKRRPCRAHARGASCALAGIVRARSGPQHQRAPSLADDLHRPPSPAHAPCCGSRRTRSRRACGASDAAARLSPIHAGFDLKKADRAASRD
jgi:hypothetical protein